MLDDERRIHRIMQRSAHLWDEILNPDNWGGKSERAMDKLDGYILEIERIQESHRSRTLEALAHGS